MIHPRYLKKDRKRQEEKEQKKNRKKNRKRTEKEQKKKKQWPKQAGSKPDHQQQGRRGRGLNDPKSLRSQHSDHWRSPLRETPVDFKSADTFFVKVWWLSQLTGYPVNCDSHQTLTKKVSADLKSTGVSLRGDLQWSECWDLNDLGSLRPRPLLPYC